MGWPEGGMRDVSVIFLTGPYSKRGDGNAKARCPEMIRNNAVLSCERIVSEVSDGSSRAIVKERSSHSVIVKPLR